MTTRLLVGDVFDRMRELPDGSFDLILCSPPFLALRSYLPDGHPDKAKEIGSEPTPAVYLDTLLALTAEWRRLLAPHGSLAVELGDTYAGSGGAGGDYDDGGFRDGQARFNGAAAKARAHAIKERTRTPGLGWPLDKSLTGIPTLYAWSLAYGRNLLTGQPSPAGQWRVRNLKPWIRSNPPVGALGDKERPATSYITVACVSRDRWFDLDAVRTAPAAGWRPRLATTGTKGPNLDRGDLGGGNYGVDPGGAPPLDWWHQVDAVIDRVLDERAGKGANRRTAKGVGQQARTGKSADRDGNWGSLPELGETNGSVGARGVHIRRALEAAGILPQGDFYDVSPKGYAGAHYAVWPPELVRLMIDEMCPRRVCVTCGVPSRRITQATEEYAAASRAMQDQIGLERNGSNRTNPDRLRRGASGVRSAGVARVAYNKPTVGWSDCGCVCTDCEAARFHRPQTDLGGLHGRCRICHEVWPCAVATAAGDQPCSHHWRPGRVLDPFVGSGTTLAVASGMGRDSVGIDLDERNADLARERCGMFLEVEYPEREVPA